MKFFQLLLLCLIFNASCKIEEGKNEDDCKIDSELVRQILQINKHKVIESDFSLEESIKKYGCAGVDSFLQYKRWDDTSFSRVNKKANDSLCYALNLEKFENLISKEENQGDQIIRIERSIFAYGANEILLVEGHQRKDTFQLKSYRIHFDRNCNTALLQFPNGKEFTSKCFEIEEAKFKKLSLSQWKKIKKLISDTNFNNTTYFQGGGKLLCHGPHYSIDYSAGYSLEYGVRHLEKSCPGELTAIYLISEKLIEMSEIIK